MQKIIYSGEDEFSSAIDLEHQRQMDQKVVILNVLFSSSCRHLKKRTLFSQNDA